MNYRCLDFVAVIAALVSLAQGQSAQPNWTPPRTPDGHLDFQGGWANNIATPLERPRELAGRPLLTDEEVAAMRKKAHELFNGQGDAAFFETVFTTVYANVKGTRSGFKSTDGETGDYSLVWTVERDWDNRTSLITDPSDGRLPPMTAEVATRSAGQRALGSPGALIGRADQAQDRPLQERCITYGSPSLVAGLPKRLLDFTNTRICGRRDGDDSRCPRDSAGRRAASSLHSPTMAGGFARAPGRRHAGRGHYELQAESLSEHIER